MHIFSRSFVSNQLYNLYFWGGKSVAHDLEIRLFRTGAIRVPEPEWPGFIIKGSRLDDLTDKPIYF